MARNAPPSFAAGGSAFAMWWDSRAPFVVSRPVPLHQAAGLAFAGSTNTLSEGMYVCHTTLVPSPLRTSRIDFFWSAEQVDETAGQLRAMNSFHAKMSTPACAA